MSVEPTWAEMDLYVHLVSHLRAEKGRGPYTPTMFVYDCWPVGEMPDWAAEMAEANAPGWQWCPRITPALLARA
ncbi:MAG TPA: hypothetical protein VIT65_15580 [Microlunatus sp.]